MVYRSNAIANRRCSQADERDYTGNAGTSRTFGGSRSNPSRYRRLKIRNIAVFFSFISCLFTYDVFFWGRYAG